MNASAKKTVWRNIFRLIIPYRKKFIWVVTLGLLSTGASLIEPLIYREAINDVAGLFVKQARENAQKDLGLDPGDASDIKTMIEEETTDSDGGAAAEDSVAVPPGNAVVKPDNIVVTPGKETEAHKTTVHA